MIWWMARVWAAPTEADLDRAMELFDNGQELYAEGNYEDAIAAWQTSYQLSGRHALLFNLANAQERLGRYEDAIESLNRYRAFASAEERAQLDLRVRNLVRLADRQTDPSPQEAPPEDVPAATEDAVAEAPPVAPVDAPAPPQQAAEPSSADPTPGRSPRPLIGGGLIALGGASWIGAVGTGLAFRSARDEVATLCVNLEQGITCPVEAMPVLRKQSSFAYATDALLVVGAIAAGVGVGLAFGKQASATVGPDGLVISGRF